MSTSRCPSCAAAVRADAPWCLLCYTDLRPAPAPARVEAPALATTVHATVPASSTASEQSAGRHAKGWPCAACDAANSFDAAVCTTCGAGFLAGLSEQDRAGVRFPVVGDISRLSRSARLGLAVAVGLFASLLLSGLVVVVGKVLG